MEEFQALIIVVFVLCIGMIEVLKRILKRITRLEAVLEKGEKK